MVEAARAAAGRPLPAGARPPARPPLPRRRPPRPPHRTMYRTVVEVVRWDAEGGEAVVVSGWGERASWWRNLQAEPAVEVWMAGERFEPEQRFLELAERGEVLRSYGRDRPHAAHMLAQLLGLGWRRRRDRRGRRALADGRVQQRLDHVSGRGRYLTVAQARRVYDRIGRIQDTAGALRAPGDEGAARSRRLRACDRGLRTRLRHRRVRGAASSTGTCRPGAGTSASTSARTCTSSRAAGCALRRSC